MAKIYKATMLSNEVMKMQSVRPELVTYLNQQLRRFKTKIKLKSQLAPEETVFKGSARIISSNKKKKLEAKRNLFSFSRKGIKIGELVSFIENPNIQAKVVNDNKVEFKGKEWRLSSLTKYLMNQIGKANNSGAYQGANYFVFKGERLTKIKDV